MLIGSRAAARGRLRVGGLVLGCLATVSMALMGVLAGCTTVTEGTSTVDTAMAQAYRTSMSASRSAASVTSSIRESQRQATLTRRAVQNACLSFLSSAKEALAKSNAYVNALNSGASTAATEGPAKDSLNHTADLTAGSISPALSAELREALTAYVDAARALAKVVGPSTPQSTLNGAIDHFNDTINQAKQSCRTALH
ncbi:MAG: hypothetical protein ACRDTV_18385 [Mycobacterium sp.]